MVLEVLAHPGQVGDHVDAQPLEQPGGADAGQLEQLRGVDRTAAQDDLAAADQPGRARTAPARYTRLAMDRDPELFREVFGRFATGVAVITSAGATNSGGMTANALCSHVARDPHRQLERLLVVETWIDAALVRALEAGFVDAPQGRFRASQGSIAWAWILDGPGRGAPPPPTRMEFAAGIEAVDVARLDGQAHRITADLLKISRFVSPHAYLSGQLQSAVSGGAGGYSAGFFGLGWRQPVFDSAWHASAELMAGAGGGGGVTSGGGLAQAMISAGCQLSPSLLLSLGAGRVQSLRRSFGSNVVDASLTFVYGKTDRAD